ncbi:hypothetical protein HELRODRAFT_177167 [Helobdella robusta]|uniref:Chitin-binding type-2 domain-containing protein n=1 Tax=Helobdella robusta TaxID=6412 RepID=T1FBB0_HELRO|nr:hypothetical protein HELRODRAFT_177167 [Helobdella robusta]ESN98285.1 hypothetical protein HELRODRAFT_177167 [Helobdella robusta]
MLNAIVIVALLGFVPNGHSWDENKFNCDNNIPCTKEFRDQGQYYFAYDADDTQFIQCDQTGGCSVMQCANETVWSTNIYTSVLAFRDLGQYYLAYDASDSKFVQCAEHGCCFVMECAPGTVWSSEAYTCVHV